MSAHKMKVQSTVYNKLQLNVIIQSITSQLNVIAMWSQQNNRLKILLHPQVIAMVTSSWWGKCGGVEVSRGE